MNGKQPPIPPHIWKRILAWLESGGTGRITLDAHQGHVCDGWINERIGKTDGVVDRREHEQGAQT